jgi:hypothetical protein
VKKIKPDEQFQLDDQVFTYTVNESGQILIKRVKKGVKVSKHSFVPPTLADCIVYFHKKGYDAELAKKFFNGYDVAGWKDSNDRRIKNWMQKAEHVWFKDGNKLPIKEKSESKFMF